MYVSGLGQRVSESGMQEGGTRGENTNLEMDTQHGMTPEASDSLCL